MSVSIADLLSQLGQLNASQDQATAAYAKNTTQRQQLDSTIVDKTTKLGNLAAQQTLAEGQMKMQTEDARLEAANAFGTNVQDQSNVIIQLANTLKQKTANVEAAQAARDRRVSQAESGNIVASLYNTFYGDEDEANLKELKDSQAETFNSIQQLNAATQQTAITQNTIAKITNAATIKNAAEQQKLLADINASKASIDSLQAGADLVNFSRQVGAQKFNATMATYSDIQAMERWNAEAPLRKAQAEVAERAIQDAKDSDAIIQQNYENISKFRSANKLPPISLQEFRQVIKNPNSASYADFTEQSRLGAGYGSPTGQVALGYTSGEAYLNALKYKIDVPDGPASTLLQEAATNVNRAIQQSAKYNPNAGIAPPAELARIGITTKDAKDPNIVAAAITKEASYLAQTNQADVSSKDNPYGMVPIKSITDEATALTQSKFGQEVLSPIATVKPDSVEPKLVVASAVQAVRDGKLTMPEAVDGIVKTFQESNSLLTSTGGFSRLNVPVPNGFYTSDVNILGKQSLLRSALNFTSIANPAEAVSLLESRKNNTLSGSPLDLTDPKQVQLLLSVSLSRDRASQIVDELQQGNK